MTPQKNTSKRDKDKLTLYEKRFLKAVAEGHNGREAAFIAYNPSNKESADNIASKVLKRDRFQKALEKVGLSDNLLARTFKEGLSATKPIVIKDKITDYKDYSTRHQFLKTALVVKGYYRRTDDAEESVHDPLIVKSIQMLNQTINVGTTNNSTGDEVIEGSIGGEKKDSGNPR